MFPSTETLLTWSLQLKFIIGIIIIIGWIAVGIWAIGEWRKQKKREEEERMEWKIKQM